MLWLDKHRPATLDKMEVHKELNENLKSMLQTEDFPHLLFYGPSGAGKKTRILGILRELFGKKAENLKVEAKEIKAGSAGTTEVVISIITSGYHYEFTPSEAGYHDKYVVSQVIKEIAQTIPLSLDNNSNNAQPQHNQKIVILNQVDELTKEAQQALRRTMEKYTKTCRLILCATNSSRVLDPIKSRCLCMRVPAPTKEDQLSVLQSIAKKENLKAPQDLYNFIIDRCDRNMRRGIMMLETYKIMSLASPDNQLSDMNKLIPEWQRFIRIISKSICADQSPAQLYRIREQLYLVLGNCIPPDVILRQLCEGLMEISTEDVMKHKIAACAAFYDERMKNGSKPIMHLEAFVAQFMCIFQQHFDADTDDDY